MSKIKPVKCENCQAVCGRRKDNWFAEHSIWQHHRRSFTFVCPKCNHTNFFRVNQNTAQRLELAAVVQILS